MIGARKIVLVLAVMLFLVWVVMHFGMIAGDENGKARFFLGIVFALMILIRRKDRGLVFEVPSWVTPFSALTGTVLALVGIIFSVGQFEWLGLLMLLFSALHWALDKRRTRNILLALFVLYWIHPLPGQLFFRLQLLLQVVSVRAAEWMLHCFNYRVWADGITLNTGFQTFLVPESCSGMVTVVTVLLTALGIGILLRMKWFETAILMFAGAMQAVVLNIIRIFFMVVWSLRMSSEWAGTFLHDTLGFLLFLSVLLVQVEAVYWKMRTTRRLRQKRGIETGEVEEPERATILPRFWRLLNRWAWVGAFSFVLTAGVMFAIYKKRPAHRAVMISEVVDGLMERDLEKAERAIQQVLQLNPGRREFLSKRVQVMVLRGKYTDALTEIEKFRGKLSTTENVMKSFALMSLKRDDEAIVLIESLSEAEKKIPGVAMIRAEYAAGKNLPGVVASNVVIASISPLLIHRVRGLFPYLGAHQQWRAIADSDNTNVPYKDCSHALIVVYAGLELGDVFRASRALKAGLTVWPNDPRFIGSLYMLAAKRPGSEWEGLFADNIRVNISNLDTDRLASYMEYCFKLKRPDLAWLLYVRLREMDPHDPALYLVPAQFGKNWFIFRRHQIGIAAGDKTLSLDLKSFSRKTRTLRPFKSFWDNVPLVDEMSADSVESKRLKYLNQCLAELERRKAAGRINRRMHMTYPGALFMAGRFKEAEAVLDELEQKYPDAARDLLFQRAVFYDQQGQWQKSYEVLMKYRRLSTSSDNLNANIMLINAMLNLNMGVCAMDVAEREREAFPDSNQTLMTIAAIWNIFGFKDQALFLLSRNGDQGWNSGAIAQLLYETGCYREADKLGRSMGIEINKKREFEKQGVFPLPAELVIVRRWPEKITTVEMDRESEQQLLESGRAVSPFIRELKYLTAKWYAAKGHGNVSDPAKWLAVGRDDMEKVGALYHLAMLLARQKEYEKASDVIERAIVMMPRSAMLWRILVSLTAGDSDVIRRARLSCPTDPELWLASLVVRTRKEGGGKWLLDEMTKVAANKDFAPGVMVRAGDFLLRKKMVEPASAAAKSAIERCRGSISAYVLGLRCALTVKDVKLALSCVLLGIEYARDPGPFYRLLVEIKSIGKATDADMIAALEYLQEHFPKEKQWAERLGDAYFHRGNIKRAMSVLDEAMVGSLRGVKVRSLLLAAEAARLEGEYAKAIKILENGHSVYPDMPSILNNLVYTLARHGEDLQNVARAKELLPKLIEVGGKSAQVLDTVAMVYMRTGDLVRAKEYAEKAQDLFEKDEYAALEADFNSAELIFRMGDLRGAKELLDRIGRARDRYQFVDFGIKELLKRIEEESRKR